MDALGGREGKYCLGLGALALSSPPAVEFLLPVNCMELKLLPMVVPLSVGTLVSERLDELALLERQPGMNFWYHRGFSSVMACMGSTSLVREDRAAHPEPAEVCEAHPVILQSLEERNSFRSTLIRAR